MRATLPAISVVYRERLPGVTLDLAQLTQHEQLERLERGVTDKVNSSVAGPEGHLKEFYCRVSRRLHSRRAPC